MLHCLSCRHGSSLGEHALKSQCIFHFTGSETFTKPLHCAEFCSEVRKKLIGHIPWWGPSPGPREQRRTQEVKQGDGALTEGKQNGQCEAMWLDSWL